MSYGSVAFTAVTALIKILFMILGFLMPLASILTWLERRQSVDDAGSPRPQPRQHPAALEVEREAATGACGASPTSSPTR